MKNKKKFIEHLEDLNRSLLGREGKIIEIPLEIGQIGFTSEDRTIHLSFDHPLILDVAKKYKANSDQLFVKGVDIHEVLHQMLSDFHMLNLLASKYNRSEQEIVMTINNLVEDAYIEHQAKLLIGGDSLKALRFTILSFYEFGSGVNDAPDPLSQFITALMNFGDVGAIKGHFTFPEAEEIAYKCLPVFYKATKEIIPKKRIEYSQQIMEMSKPLWEKQAQENQEAFEKMMKAVQELLEQSGKSIEQSGSPMMIPGDAAGDEDSISQQQAQALAGLQGNSEADSDADSGNDGNGNGDDDEKSTQLDDSGKAKNHDKGKFGFGEKGKHPDSSMLTTENTSEFLSSLKSELDLSDDQIEQIASELEASVNDGPVENTKTEFENAEDVSFRGPYYNSNKYTVNNIKVNTSIEQITVYNRVVATLNDQITILYNKLKNVFQQDVEEIERRTSGNINLKRYTSGTVSARIFDKRKAPKNKADMAVAILFDESASMGGEKTKAAMQTSIILAEVFKRLDIPFFAMGFTTGINADVAHMHYINWSNTTLERISLLNMNSYNCNFDGYSIRYVTEILKKKDAENKLLIVASDGAPSFGPSQKIQDTANAVKEAKEISSVCGISIENHDDRLLSDIYGNDYIHVDKCNQLAFLFANKVAEIVKKW